MEQAEALGRLGVPGNLEVQGRLLQYLQGGRVHPAVLLVGPKNPLRWVLAKNIAKQLLCPEAGSHTLFCGQCSLCRRVDKEIHPDVLLLQELEEETLKIDSLRDICHQMSLTPMEARGKICLVDDCHRMNTAAANAFLKTLEEPQADRYFWLLTAQPSSLPETLLSRCLMFRLKPELHAAALNEADQETYSKLFQEAVAGKSAAPLLSVLTTKEKTFHFVQYLETELRNAIVGEPSLFSSQKTAHLRRTFEEALVLEGRLRSNASYSLMFDSFFRTHFV